MRMQIVISPAKKMRSQIAYVDAKTKPYFIKYSKQLCSYMKTLNLAQMQTMLQCTPPIAKWAMKCYQNIDLSHEGTAAILAYDGIQYHYMKPDIFDEDAFSYVEQHLFILSGLYGVLRAFDGVVPYRLEMNASFHTAFCTSLYDFWGSKLYQFITKEDHQILNLASKQYAKSILKYQTPSTAIVTCYFYENDAGILREKGVYVKMARGEMVRYLAVHHVNDFKGVKQFHALGYRYDAQRSTASSFVFVRDCHKKNEN